MLRQRMLTAAVLIPPVLWSIFRFEPWSFALLLAAIVAMAAWEFSGLLGGQTRWQRLAYTAGVVASLPVAHLFPVTLILSLSLIGWLCLLLWVIAYNQQKAWASQIPLYWRGVAGGFVLVACWVAIVALRVQTQGSLCVLALLLLVYGADSVAFFVGRRWGQHKLALQVSPGKSVEGVLGALVMACVFFPFGVWFFDIPLHHWPAVLIVMLLTVLFSVLGDLFESLIKRLRGVKDSGHILPGHGGVLDRIDSLTAASPLFSLGILLLGVHG